MGLFSSLFACLGCSQSSPPAKQQKNPQPKAQKTQQNVSSTQGVRPGNVSSQPRTSEAPAKQDAKQPTSATSQEAPPAEGTVPERLDPNAAGTPARPSPTRQSSRVQLDDLPLEYVHTGGPDDDPEDSMIKGRGASFTVDGDVSRTNSSSNLLALNTQETGESKESEVEAESMQSPQEVNLLGVQEPTLKGRKCLVLDLDETLVHSSFKYLPDADFVIPVEVEGRVHSVFVVKRPGVDEFLQCVGKLFEVVVFTASVSKYGDPLLDHLDASRVVHHRLFREACYNFNGNYIKNLSQLGRPLRDVIIIDNSPASYALQPQNAVPVSSWFSDQHDNELLDMLPFLEDLASNKVQDVSLVLDVYIG